MIDKAQVWFTGEDDPVNVSRVKFIDGGFVGMRADDGWVYYPRESIMRILPERDAE